jgi:hypothetical protein
MVADLKDGKGSKPETGLKRWTFGDDYIGTCIQTFDGGMHFRYFKQNTTHEDEADGTGAIFLAVSAEKDLSQKHDIVTDGYNLGRDYLVGNLTQRIIRTSHTDMTPGTDNITIVDEQVDYRGTKTLDSITYKTTVRYVSKQIENTSGKSTHVALPIRSFSRPTFTEKINHAEKVTQDGNNAVDGLIAVITVEIEESK